MEKVNLKIKEMKNNSLHSESVVVAEFNGYYQVFTSEGELLPLNVSTEITDSVGEVMTVTATFKCRIGEVVK